MAERRSMFMLFIGFMVCISIWEISVRENKVTTESHYRFENDDSNGITAPVDSAMDSAEHQLNHTLIRQRQKHRRIPAPNIDKHILIDLHDFDYLINQPKCLSNASNDHDKKSTEERPIVLILIHSAPKNFNKRNVIRETWGQNDSRAHLYFLLGAVKTAAAQAKIQHEHLQYNDIIQGNFIDSYRNMTYKHIMALKWFVYNCQHVKYLLKTDDDVFVNTPALYQFLSSNSSNDHSYLFCHRLDASRIKRSYRSKWRVSTKEYPGWYYPPYCPGFSIIYSNDVVYQLYREAQQTPYFWIDDVHVTGTLAHNLNLNITSVGEFYMDCKQRDNVFNGNLEFIQIKPMFLFTEPNLLEKQIRDLWQITIKSLLS